MPSPRYYGFTDREFCSRFRVCYIRERVLDLLLSSGNPLSFHALYDVLASGLYPRSIRFFFRSHGPEDGWACLYMPFNFESPCKVILHTTPTTNTKSSHA